jgi:hypothetical protein
MEIYEHPASVFKDEFGDYRGIPQTTAQGSAINFDPAFISVESDIGGDVVQIWILVREERIDAQPIAFRRYPVFSFLDLLNNLATE